MRAARPCKRKLWGILPAPFESRAYGREVILYSTKIDATAPEIPRVLDRALAKTRKTKSRISRIVSAKSRGIPRNHPLIEEEEARWLIERTWLSERTSEGTIAYSWRGGHDRRCRRASETVNAQNSGGVNELDHVRSRPGPPPRLYSLYRGLVFPMGPRLISWLCESVATCARVSR